MSNASPFKWRHFESEIILLKLAESPPGSRAIT
jgi:hypothetical protein